jgi:hypothetical protein
MDVSIQRLEKYEGAFRLAATSGLLTGVAAATNADTGVGHLFAFRWQPTVNPTPTRYLKWCVIQRIRAHWRTISGFTAAQEVGLDMYKVTGYSASHSGGTALTLTAPTNEKRTGVAPAAGVNRGGQYGSQVADLRIATTGALTAGTFTIDSNPLAQDCYAELAAAATVPKGRFDLEFLNQDDPGFPLVLAPAEGIIIRNTVAMGTGGTARLIVELDWLEVNFSR